MPSRLAELLAAPPAPRSRLNELLTPQPSPTADARPTSQSRLPELLDLDPSQQPKTDLAPLPSPTGIPQEPEGHLGRIGFHAKREIGDIASGIGMLLGKAGETAYETVTEPSTIPENVKGFLSGVVDVGTGVAKSMYTTGRDVLRGDIEALERRPVSVLSDVLLGAGLGTSAAAKAGKVAATAGAPTLAAGLERTATALKPSTWAKAAIDVAEKVPALGKPITAIKQRREINAIVHEAEATKVENTLRDYEKGVTDVIDRLPAKLQALEMLNREGIIAAVRDPAVSAQLKTLPRQTPTIQALQPDEIRQLNEASKAISEIGTKHFEALKEIKAITPEIAEARKALPLGRYALGDDASVEAASAAGRELANQLGIAPGYAHHVFPAKLPENVTRAFSGLVRPGKPGLLQKAEGAFGYSLDPKLSLAMQIQATRNYVFQSQIANAVAKHPLAIKAAQGVAMPEGYAYWNPQEHLRLFRKTIETADEVKKALDAGKQAGIIDDIMAKAILDLADDTSISFLGAAKTEGYFLPKPMVNQLGIWFERSPTGDLVRNLITRPTNEALRTMVLKLSPVHIANTFASGVLATVMGAASPMDLYWAARAPKAFPRQLGAAAGQLAEMKQVLADVVSPANRGPILGAWDDFLRAHPRAEWALSIGPTITGKIDGFFRRAAYLSDARKQQLAGKILSVTDDASEVTRYLESIQATPAAHAQAMQNMRNWFGNYDRLGPVERAVIREIMPFYTWSRHMHRFAAHYPATSPVRQAITRQIGELQRQYANERWQDLGVDPAALTEWEKFYYPTESGRVVGTFGATPVPAAPTEPLETFRSGLGPVPRLLVEQATGTESFTGRPFTTYPGEFVESSRGEMPRPPIVAHAARSLIPRLAQVEELVAGGRLPGAAPLFGKRLPPAQGQQYDALETIARMGLIPFYPKERPMQEIQERRVAPAIRAWMDAMRRRARAEANP